MASSNSAAPTGPTTEATSGNDVWSRVIQSRRRLCEALENDELQRLLTQGGWEAVRSEAPANLQHPPDQLEWMLQHYFAVSIDERCSSMKRRHYYQLLKDLLTKIDRAIADHNVHGAAMRFEMVPNNNNNVMDSAAPARARSGSAGSRWGPPVSHRAPPPSDMEMSPTSVNASTPMSTKRPPGARLDISGLQETINLPLTSQNLATHNASLSSNEPATSRMSVSSVNQNQRIVTPAINPPEKSTGAAPPSNAPVSGVDESQGPTRATSDQPVAARPPAVAENHQILARLERLSSPPTNNPAASNGNQNQRPTSLARAVSTSSQPPPPAKPSSNWPSPPHSPLTKPMVASAKSVPAINNPVSQNPIPSASTAGATSATVSNASQIPPTKSTTASNNGGTAQMANSNQIRNRTPSATTTNPQSPILPPPVLPTKATATLTNGKTTSQTGNHDARYLSPEESTAGASSSPSSHSTAARPPQAADAIAKNATGSQTDSNPYRNPVPSASTTGATLRTDPLSHHFSQLHPSKPNSTTSPNGGAMSHTSNNQSRITNANTTNGSVSHSASSSQSTKPGTTSNNTGTAPHTNNIRIPIPEGSDARGSPSNSVPSSHTLQAPSGAPGTNLTSIRPTQPANNRNSSTTVHPPSSTAPPSHSLEVSSATSTNAGQNQTPNNRNQIPSASSTGNSTSNPVSSSQSSPLPTGRPNATLTNNVGPTHMTNIRNPNLNASTTASSHSSQEQPASKQSTAFANGNSKSQTAPRDVQGQSGSVVYEEGSWKRSVAGDSGSKEPTTFMSRTTLSQFNPITDVPASFRPPLPQNGSTFRPALERPPVSSKSVSSFQANSQQKMVAPPSSAASAMDRSNSGNDPVSTHVSEAVRRNSYEAPAKHPSTISISNPVVSVPQNRNTESRAQESNENGSTKLSPPTPQQTSNPNSAHAREAFTRHPQASAHHDNAKSPLRSSDLIANGSKISTPNSVSAGALSQPRGNLSSHVKEARSRSPTPISTTATDSRSSTNQGSNGRRQEQGSHEGRTNLHRSSSLPSSFPTANQNPPPSRRASSSNFEPQSRSTEPAYRRAPPSPIATGRNKQTRADVTRVVSTNRDAMRNDHANRANSTPSGNQSPKPFPPLTLTFQPEFDRSKAASIYGGIYPRYETKVTFTPFRTDQRAKDQVLDRLAEWEPFWRVDFVASIGQTWKVDKLDRSKQDASDAPATATEISWMLFQNRASYIRDWGINKVQKDNTHGEFRLLLFMLPFQVDMTKRADTHLWPKGTFLTLDGTPVCLKQRKQASHDPKKWYGMCDFLDLTQHIKQPLANHKIQMCCVEQAPFFYCLAVCQHVAPENLFVQKPLISLSRDEATKRALEFAKPMICLDSDDEDGHQDGAGKVVFSMVCPLSKVIMKKPVRGKCCSHFQCFDLLYFLGLNLRSCGSRWKCASCENYVSWRSLQYCGLTAALLQEFQGQASVVRDRIEFRADGRYRLLEESKTRNNKKRPSAEENVDAHSSKRPAMSIPVDAIEIDD